MSPDVAHCHSIDHHLSPSILGVLTRFGVRTVLTLRDLKLACPACRMLDENGVCEKCKNGKVYNVLKNRRIKSSVPLSAVIMTQSLVDNALKSYARNVDLFISPCRFYIDKLVGWGGWTFTRRSAEELTAVLRLAMTTPGVVIVGMGRAARRQVEAQFSAQRYLDRLTELWSELGVAA